MKRNILRAKLKQIFNKYQLSKKHSEICADYLIKAELVEAKSHGLTRLKMYCDRIKKKLINPKPKIKLKKIQDEIAKNWQDRSYLYGTPEDVVKTLSMWQEVGIEAVYLQLLDLEPSKRNESVEVIQQAINLL